MEKRCTRPAHRVRSERLNLAAKTSPENKLLLRGGAFILAGDDCLPAESTSTDTTPALRAAGRWLVLGTAFLGWFFAGVLMSTTSLAMRPAALDLLARVGTVAREGSPELKWFAYYQCAFLFGAAAVGLVFGRLGDRIGRSAAMA